MQWVVRKNGSPISKDCDLNQNGSSELYHYGVPGMRWGVRKDDYNSKDKTTRLKKDTGNKKDKTVRTEYGVEKTDIYDTSDYVSKKAMVDLVSKKMPDRYADKKNAQEKLDNLPRFNTRLTQDQQVVATNHDAQSQLRTVNCFSCSMAYEMRRRGYNVQSKEVDGGWGFETLHCFDVKDAFTVSINASRERSSDKLALAKECYKQLENQCLSYGNGARGQLGIQYYDYNAGHAMNWVVEDGKFKIINSQSLNNGYELFLHAEADVEVYRLDNAEILPGVTDFVESFEATDEEKDKAKPKALNMAEARAKKEADEKHDANRKAREDAQRKAMKEIEAQRSTVEKLIRKVKTATNDLIAKGKRFLKNPLNIRAKKVNTTRSSNVTWEIVD